MKAKFPMNSTISVLSCDYKQFTFYYCFPYVQILYITFCVLCKQFREGYLWQVVNPCRIKVSISELVLTSLYTQRARLSSQQSFSSGPLTKAPQRMWGLGSELLKSSQVQGAGRSGQELKHNNALTFCTRSDLTYIIVVTKYQYIITATLLWRFTIIYRRNSQSSINNY